MWTVYSSLHVHVFFRVIVHVDVDRGVRWTTILVPLCEQNWG